MYDCNMGVCLYSVVYLSLSLQIGEMCAVQFSEDSLWYRGQIIAVHGDQVQVLFIDYGNEENKRGNEVREFIKFSNKILWLNFCFQSLAGVKIKPYFYILNTVQKCRIAISSCLIDSILIVYFIYWIYSYYLSIPHVTQVFELDRELRNVAMQTSPSQLASIAEPPNGWADAAKEINILCG